MIYNNNTVRRSHLIDSGACLAHRVIANITDTTTTPHKLTLDHAKMRCYGMIDILAQLKLYFAATIHNVK